VSSCLTKLPFQVLEPLLSGQLCFSFGVVIITRQALSSWLSWPLLAACHQQYSGSFAPNDGVSKISCQVVQQMQDCLHHTSWRWRAGVLQLPICALMENHCTKQHLGVNQQGSDAMQLSCELTPGKSSQHPGSLLGTSENGTFTLQMRHLRQQASKGVMAQRAYFA